MFQSMYLRGGLRFLKIPPWCIAVEDLCVCVSFNFVCLHLTRARLTYWDQCLQIYSKTLTRIQQNCTFHAACKYIKNQLFVYWGHFRLDEKIWKKLDILIIS